MVDFEGYYSFPADQVESVEVYTLSADEMPHKLRVTLKSGRSLVVNYKSKAARDGAKQILCNRIDQELRQESVQISNKLFLVLDYVQRLDKRQFRIWRQLKQLLQLPVEATADEQDPGNGED